jgi:hypothetical protein
MYGDVMKFGRYKGRPWKDIPVGYWKWLRANVNLYGRTLEVCEAVLAGKPVPPLYREVWKERDVDGIVKPARGYDDDGPEAS